MSKTNNDPQGLDKLDHEVDAISGATITGDGVTAMISERLAHYTPYINNIKIALNKLNASQENELQESVEVQLEPIAYQN